MHSNSTVTVKMNKENEQLSIRSIITENVTVDYINQIINLVLIISYHESIIHESRLNWCYILIKSHIYATESITIIITMPR